MNPEPGRIKNLFSAALEQPDLAAREAFLDRECAGDPDLRQRVGVLLSAHDAPASALDRPLAEIAADVPEPGVTVDGRSSSEAPGADIGPFKLLQQIGEGGMGTVWMAEQTHPVQRRVALKIIKAGMDTRQVIARFEAERQALALMDHPNIAKVLDAGATDSGRPYFVMELVKGTPITKYCDEHRLTPRERLDLFLPVCQAIQHAHQKGIIHRDIKPTNVLVAPYDGKPVVKVIDFGVAKATGQRLTEKTLFTEFGAVVGTLEYMSPEQAELNNQDIDTRSDIYSLGVLLYELLTGTTPLDRSRLKNAVFTEMLRMIREEEPPKPSTRLSESQDALPSISAQRHMEPATLTKLVKGELDWIVMKALDKDRNRRYETANGFAMDVQRYLADEQVLACPPSVGYRLRKFVRRNRSGLAVAGLVLFFVVLLGGGTGWTWRDRAARQAEQASNLEHAVERAELLQREGKRGEALAALERALLLAREADAAPLLARRIESLQQRLDAEGRDEVFVASFEAIRREVLTEVNLEKSAFRGDTAYPKLREALEHYGIAVGAIPPAAAVAHIQKRPPAIQTVVIAALDACVHYVPRGDPGAREWLVEVLQKADSDPWRNKARRARKQPEALEALAKDVDVQQQPPSFLVLVAWALPIESPSRFDLARRVQFAYPGDFWANHSLGFDLARAGKHAEAIRYYTAALALRPDNPGVLLNRANALREVGEFEAAIADCQRVVALAPRYVAAHVGLGNALACHALASQTKLDEAIASYHKAIELDSKNAYAYNDLGTVLADQKKVDEAIAAFHKAIEIDPKLAVAHNNLGTALFKQKKVDEAIACYNKAIELDPKKANAYSNLGSALCDQKKLDEAVTACRKAIEVDPKHARAHINLGRALAEQKKWDEAFAACRKAIELDPKNVTAHNNLGSALAGQKKWDEAILWYKKAIELDETYAPAHTNLGVALADQEKWNEAIVWYNKAIKLDANNPRAYFYLGIALFRTNRIDEAIDCYKKSIKLDAKTASTHNNLGAAFAAQKNWNEAIDCYKNAIELDQKHVSARLNLGIALAEQKKWDDAVACFRKVIEFDPKHAKAHNNLGGVLKNLGKLEEAVVASRTAVELEPKNPTYHHNLAIVLEAQDYLDEALRSWRKAIELDPKNAGRLNNLAWRLVSVADVKLRNPKEAMDLARRAVKLDSKPWNHWNTLSVACYRAGEWQEALQAREEAIRRNDKGKAMCWNGLGMAMIRWQLGQKAEARAAYHRVVEESKKHAFQQSFRQEAERLLEIKPENPDKK